MELNSAPSSLAPVCRVVFPYCWATVESCCCAAAAPSAVMLTPYQGRNTETASMADPSAATRKPSCERSSRMALRVIGRHDGSLESRGRLAGEGYALDDVALLLDITLLIVHGT